MAKYKFLGTDACPKEITIRGETFKANKAVDVSDASLEAKLAALPYFALVKPRGSRKNDEDGE